MDVKQVAIEKALAFLKAAGADYIVRFQGETHESENCPFGEKEPEKETYTRKKLHDFANTTGYIAAINNMQIGDVLTFARTDYPILESDVAWVNFKASVHSKARYRLGKDNFAFAVVKDDSCVEVMRAQ